MELRSGQDIQIPNKCILTEREIEYLSLAALGCKNYIIADLLIVTTSTVKKTLKKIYEKLCAKDRANAVAIAFAHGIFDTKILSDIAKLYNIEDTTKHISYGCPVSTSNPPVTGKFTPLQ